MTGKVTKAQRLDSELAVLFGRSVLTEAQRLRDGDWPIHLDIDTELIVEATRQLMAERGHPERQRAIVQGMDEETALTLCCWLRESSYGPRLIRRARLESV